MRSPTDPLAVMFKTETLQYKISFNSTTFQTIHLEVTPLSGKKTMVVRMNFQWVEESLSVSLSVLCVDGKPEACVDATYLHFMYFRFSD